MHCSYWGKIFLFIVTAFYLREGRLSAQESLSRVGFAHHDTIRYGKRVSYLSDNKKENELDRFIDSILTNYMQSSQNCGISIAINRGGLEHFYNYGLTRRDSGDIPSRHTIYEIGALSNSFCGLLLARAVLEKRLNWNNDVRKFLPEKCGELMSMDKPILVKHLPSHTSSLPGIPENLREQADFDPKDPFKNYTKSLLLEELQTISLESVPGKLFAYSPMGMALLGLILENVYGLRFEDLVKEKITQPFGMANTGIQTISDHNALLAQGYDEDGNPAPHWHFGEIPAIGGLRSSTSDMMLYLKQCMKENELNKLSQQILYSGREEKSAAWFVKSTKEGNTLFWQNGGTAGFSSFAGFIPEKEASFVLLANSGMNIEYLGIAISHYLQK